MYSKVSQLVLIVVLSGVELTRGQVISTPCTGIALACPAGQIRCDQNLACPANAGVDNCGKCVNSSDPNLVIASCVDRQYAGECAAATSGTPLYTCAGTAAGTNIQNCINTDWILDGADDCGDGSDENPCIQTPNFCDANADCTFDGCALTATCTCRAGFVGDGQTCTDTRSTSSSTSTTTSPTTTTSTTTTSSATTTTTSATTSSTSSSTSTTTSVTTATTSTSRTSQTTTTSATTTSQTTTTSSQTTTTTTATTTSVTTTTTSTATSTTSTSATTTTTSPSPSCFGRGQFKCPFFDICVTDAQVLDGSANCPFGVEESYCTLPQNRPPSGPCGPDQCTYNPEVHDFQCSCPLNYKRDPRTSSRGQNLGGYCIPDLDFANLPKDCGDIYRSDPTSTNGPYTVYKSDCIILSDCRITTECDFNNFAPPTGVTLPGGATVAPDPTATTPAANPFGPGWTAVQIRRNPTAGSPSAFSGKTWQDYKDGFGSPQEGEFWAGNEYLNDLTNSGKPYQVMLKLTNADGTTQNVLYDDFAVGSEASGFPLSLGPMLTGDADELASARGQTFSAEDQGARQTCAIQENAGWWFDAGCTEEGALNVPLVGSSSLSPGATGLTWNGKALDSVEMFVRETNFQDTLATTTPSSATTPPSCQSLGRFECKITGECVRDLNVLDSITDCADGTDEFFCQAQSTTPTGCLESDCYYNPSTHDFQCGCIAPNIAFNYTREPGVDPSRYCIPNFNFSALPQSCADVARMTPNDATGKKTIYSPTCFTSKSCWPIIETECYDNLDTNGVTQNPNDPTATPPPGTGLGTGWTAVQTRRTPNEDFARPWKDYKEGFGTPDPTNGDFWIGNDQLNDLTNKPGAPQELLIKYTTTDGQEKSVLYDSFKVGPESEDFPLTLGNVIAGDGNDLAVSNNQRFSTFDRGIARGCALNEQGGWWFAQSCDTQGALNIPLATGATASSTGTVQWAGADVSTVQMFIRQAAEVVTTPAPTTPANRQPQQIQGSGTGQNEAIVSLVALLATICLAQFFH